MVEHCNFINYLPKKVSHTDEPTVAVLNYFPVTNTEFIAGDLSAEFTNCLIYGSLDNELYVYNVKEATYQVTFKNCLIKHDQEEMPELNASDKLDFINCKKEYRS